VHHANTDKAEAWILALSKAGGWAEKAPGQFSALVEVVGPDNFRGCPLAADFHNDN